MDKGRFFTVRETAKRVGSLSEKPLRAAIARGELKLIEVPNAYPLLDLEAVTAWLLSYEKGKRRPAKKKATKKSAVKKKAAAKRKPARR